MKDATRAHLTGLFERIVPTRDGLYRLIGPVAPSEYAALLELLADPCGSTGTMVAARPAVPFVLNEALIVAKPANEGCLCIDFGTAASKVGYEPGGDRFEPLEIGDEGDDPFWVRSAVAIGADGSMAFGRKAVEVADRDGVSVLTSFKSKLWGDPAILHSPALAGAGSAFSFADAIQAYLAYLTRLTARRLQERRISAYVRRRYAMPFAYDDGRKHVRTLLGAMLGRAVLLADSLGDELIDGVPAERMRAALDAVADSNAPDWLLADPAASASPSPPARLRWTRKPLSSPST